MNSLTRIMSYNKTKLLNQENYCFECKQTQNQTLIENEIEKIVSERYSDKDEKTKIFIRKALKVHGDRYDYSKTVYIKATEKIEIVCRIEGHGSFWQTPNNHLQNRNCKKCNNEKLAYERKFTNEEFITKARKIHGDKYDYSKVNYINNNTKIIIICHNHKKSYEFLQKPNHHLNGHGCKKCADKNLVNKKLKSLQEFIKNANEIHGLGKYDYSKVKYIGNKENIIIICPKHGEFLQTPANHLKGEGCLKCGMEKVAKSHTLTLEEFIKKSNDAHGVGTYDYSKVEYININTDVIIICPKHGEFLQTPSSHLQGHGCWKCASETLAESFRLTKEEFIEKANELHGIGTYDYSKVNYVNYNTEVIIICPKHGEFKQTPNSHFNGSGCPKCKSSKGEIAVRKFLTENNIEFEEQKKFKNCKDLNSLPFDFYIPQYNLCIEFDGIQHFKPIKRGRKMTDNQAEEIFKYIQKHDQIKNEYCKKNRINLLRLNDIKTINEKITKYLLLDD